MTLNDSMYSSASGEHATPKAFYAALDEEFSFTLDAAATRANKQSLHYLGDAFARAWSGNVFLNPPYGRGIMRWVDRIIEQVPNTEVIVALLPARTDTAWWRKAAAHADEVRLVAGRLKFGDAKNSAPFPSCVMVFRTARSGRRRTIRVVLGE